MYSVDIHAHFYAKAYLDLLESHGPKHGCGVERTSEGIVILQPSGRRQGPMDPSYTDLDQRIAGMDRQETDLHVLSLTTPMVYFGDRAFSRDLAAAQNDGTAEFCQARPDRFAGFMTLPMQHADDAREELERAARLPGMKGVYMGTNVAGKNLSEPEFLPVFEKIAALGLPVYLHPTSVLAPERLNDYHLINTLGNPYDTGVAAAFLIFSGMMDKFPKLEVNLPHAGGALPYLAGRLDRGWKVRKECRGLENPPSSYLRRFSYDTISHAEAPMKYLIELVGADRVMLGSDYCFDMGYEKPVQEVMKLSWLSDDDKKAIVGGNACRSLKIPYPG